MSPALSEQDYGGPLPVVLGLLRTDAHAKRTGTAKQKARMATWEPAE
jgi:hypothetical protein